MAVLVTGPGSNKSGLHVNYDPRLRGALGIRNLQRVEVSSAMRVR